MGSQVTPANAPWPLTARRSPALPQHLLMVASGFAGLGYEMLWTRMLAVALGHEITAVLAVLAAFFVGLAFGAWALDGVLRRTSCPGRWYAALEGVIGLWAVALIWLVPAFNSVIPRWIGVTPTPIWHVAVVFGATLLLLLPATAAMGATLPAMERCLRGATTPGRRVAGLYAANTLGAVAGTLITTFVLAPRFGFASTLVGCALLNGACAVTMLLLQRRRRSAPVATEQPAGGVEVPPRLLLALLFGSGFLGIAYEVLVVRVLSQVLEDTVYTFAAVLAVYLLGTACGAALYQRRPPAGEPRLVLAGLLLATSCAALVGLALLWTAAGVYRAASVAAGGTAGAVAGDLVTALLVFGLPTVAMGALFSHLARCATAGPGLGRGLGSNTLGAALAPLLAGVLLLPATGARTALLLVALGYLLPVPVLLKRLRSPYLAWAALPAALAALLTTLPALRFLTVPEQGTVVAYREGVMAAVAVVTDGAGDRHLKVNNHFTMGSTSSGFADHRQTHLSLLLHPRPRHALVLGVGTGMSLDAARYHGDVQVTAVELVPEVLTLLDHFGTNPHQVPWPRPPRLLASDARRYVLAGEETFDVIMADLFHPSRDGAGALYTAEHFAAVRRRLAPGGLFVQWLPLFQMDLGTFEVIARTFASAFPHVQVYLPHFSLMQPVVGLVGAEQAPGYGAGYLERRARAPALRQQLRALRLDSDLALFGGFLGDRAALMQFAGSGPENRDNFPRVTYRAPAFAYEQRDGHGERLVILAEALRAAAAPLPGRRADAVFDARLDAYWRARDAYLRAGLGVRPSANVHHMLAQTREPLLAIVRTSADFDPAYLPLLTMARSLHDTDATGARELLEALQAAAPGRPEARIALRQLTGVRP